MATNLDPAVVKIREIWAQRREKGWTLARLGEAMGYPPSSAKQSAAQFLKATDPHLSSVRRFARAVGVTMAALTR